MTVQIDILAALADWPVWVWASRHWAAVAIAVTCFSLLVFVVLLMAKYVRICLTIFVDTPPPLAMGPLDFQPVHGEIVRFRSFDGTSLRGMHLNTPNRAAAKGAIVFCHEFGSDMYSCARYARPLVEAGFDVFTFDYRGHGQSSSGGRYRSLQWPSDKELEDTLGACAYVQSVLAAEGRPTRIGAFGISRRALRTEGKRQPNRGCAKRITSHRSARQNWSVLCS